jgi:hypothetical protein
VLDQQEETENGTPLVQFLQHEEPPLRAAAAQAAARLAFDSPAVQDALLARLTDADACVRRVAAEAVAELGLHVAVPILAARLQDADAPVRAAAATALGKLGASSAEVLAALFATLRDRATAVQAAAVDALATIGCTATDVAERVWGELLALLPDAEPAVALAARGGIGRVMSVELEGLFGPRRLNLAWLQGAPPAEPYHSVRSAVGGFELSIEESADDSIVIHVAGKGAGLDGFGIELSAADKWKLARPERLKSCENFPDWFEASITIQAEERRSIPVKAVLGARVVPLQAVSE